MRKLRLSLPFFILAMTCFLSGCPNTAPTPGQADAPTFTPESGSYVSAQSVAINCETQGATIRYTTDGSDPSATRGTEYSSPVQVSANTTIRAIASKAEMTESEVSEATYSFGPPAAPVISRTNPGSGEVTVTWSAVDGATSYNLYWTEGSTVTPSSGEKITGASIPQSIDSLTNGTRYAFLVTAQNDYGESVPSQVTNAVCGKVYTAGYYNNGTVDVACYWVGDQRTDLTDGVQDGRATGIFVSAGTVYTSGFYMKNGSIYTPCYWTGTTVTDLPIATAGYDAVAYDIWVSGTTVYTVGFNDLGSDVIPCLWSGTTRSVIENGANAVAYSIFLSGSTIYTAGWYYDWEDTQSIVPCYWTGATRTDLEYGYKDYGITAYVSHANSLFVSGSTVYTAGWIYDEQGIEYAVYWEGGTIHDLSDGIDSEAYAITVSGSTVYTAGTRYVGGQYTANYWTNNTRTLISEDAIAQAISVVGGTIYVAGAGSNGTTGVPCYWVGGERIDLPSDGVHMGCVCSMQVE